MHLSNLPILDSVSGTALSAKHQRVAEIIADFDPNLELAWIPTAERNSFDYKPFAIIHKNPRYVVGFYREDEVDHRLIAQLFRASGREGNQLDKVEAEEAARKVIEYKQQMDEFEEQQDFAKSLLTSPKNWYRHNGKVYH